MAGSLMWGSLTIPPAKSLNGTATKAAERQFSVAGARTIVPLVYGEDTFGWRVINVLKAADNTDALVQGVWCFAGDSVNDVKLNDLALPSGASITHYTGAQTSPDSLLVAAFAAQSITYADALTGFMYSVLRLPSALFGGELKLTARVRGRKLYDPRKDSTAGGSGSHRLATPSTWEWSACPALALGDWLSNTVYGAGQAVQWASVATVAAANDATVGSPAESRRTLGLAFVNQAGLQEMADTLRAYAGCFLLPEAAGIRLLADADAATAATFSHSAGEIAAMAPLTLRDLGNSPTAVEVFFTNTTTTPWSDDSAIASLPGAGSTLPWRLSTVRLPGVQRFSQAMREAVERLNKLTLQDLTTTVDVFDVGISLQMGDIVEVTHPIGITDKKFRTLGVDLVGPGRWRLQLLEHDPASYSDEVETEPTYSNSGTVISEADAGAGGISSYMIEIYQQRETQPATPVGGSYTFVGDVFVPPDLISGDPHWASVVALMRFNNSGANLAPGASLAVSGGASYSASVKKWGTHSLNVGGTSPGGGGTGKVESAGDVRLTGGDFTIEAWVYLNATPTVYAPIIGTYSDAAGTEVSLKVSNGDKLQALFVTSLGGYTTIEHGSTTFPMTTWVHVALSRTSGVYRLFQNGALLSTHTSTYAAATGQNYLLQMGNLGSPASLQMNGYIDDARVTVGVGRYSAAFTAPTEEFPASLEATSLWSRDQPTGTLVPTWASRYLAQTTTPAVAIDPLGPWAEPNKHVVDGAGGADSILATISEFEAAPTASRTRPGAGIYSPKYHTLVEATYTNTSGVDQFIDIAIDGGAVKTSGTGTVYLTAEFGTSSVNGTDADGDRIAYMEEVTSSPRRRTGVGSVTLAPSATVYASVAVVIAVSSGTIVATGRDCRVNLIVMPV